MIRKLSKPWLVVAVVALVMGTAMPAFADYETGLAAYELGDYEGALEEIRPLARLGSRAGLTVPTNPNDAIAKAPRGTS